jgi:hypothetical protein
MQRWWRSTERQGNAAQYAVAQYAVTQYAVTLDAVTLDAAKPPPVTKFPHPWILADLPTPG